MADSTNIQIPTFYSLYSIGSTTTTVSCGTICEDIRQNCTNCEGICQTGQGFEEQPCTVANEICLQQCQQCMEGCQNFGGDECQMQAQACTSSCQIACQCSAEGCQTCQDVCQRSCQSSCQSSCQCSDEGCQTTCQYSCQCSAQNNQIPRPANYVWNEYKIGTQTQVKVSDFNSLMVRINDFYKYKYLTPFTFLSVTNDETWNIKYYNQLIDAINGLKSYITGTIPSKKVAGDLISKTELNSIITLLNTIK